MNKEEFESLRKLAIEKLDHHGRYCIKKGMVSLETLDAEECITCNKFVLNGGMCDPI